MLHLGSTLLVSLTLYLSILDSLNEILKKISVIIENDSMHSADSTEWKLFFILQVSDDVYCEVCQCRFRKADKQYPCRICEGVFHRECVLGITDVHPSHASTIERASIKIGWSCPACVSYIHMQYTYPLLLFMFSVLYISFPNRAFYSKQTISRNYFLKFFNLNQGNFASILQDDLSLLLSEDELNQIIQTFDEEIHPKGIWGERKKGGGGENCLFASIKILICLCKVTRFPLKSFWLLNVSMATQQRKTWRGCVWSSDWSTQTPMERSTGGSF